MCVWTSTRSRLYHLLSLTQRCSVLYQSTFHGIYGLHLWRAAVFLKSFIDAISIVYVYNTHTHIYINGKLILSLKLFKLQTELILI